MLHNIFFHFQLQLVQLPQVLVAADTKSKRKIRNFSLIKNYQPTSFSFFALEMTTMASI
jgi:hypothetical protein